MKKDMYFITVSTKAPCQNDLGWWTIPGDVRMMGMVSSLKEARRIVKENVTDIQEHYYLYAIIEGVEKGLYPDYIPECGDGFREVYQWNKELKKFEKIDDDWQIIHSIIAFN